MTLEWKKQEDTDVWTAMAAGVHVSIYRADNGHWFSIGIGMPPMYMGGDGTLQSFQDLAECRLRDHSIAVLEAMGCDVMCWEKENAAEAARVLGGRELRALAKLAEVNRTVVDELAPGAGEIVAAASPRYAMEQRLLHGAPATWNDLKAMGDGQIVDDVIHDLRLAGKIETIEKCPRTHLAIWQAKKQ